MSVSKMPRERVSIVLDCSADLGRTKQSMRDECDINKILARYQKTGVVQHVAKHQGEYGFATSADFHESMEVVLKAQTMFDELPAKVRLKFHNSPAEFLEFVQDSKNLEEMRKLGLAKPELKPSAIERVAARLEAEAADRAKAQAAAAAKAQ